MDNQPADLVGLTADIVTSYVEHNEIAADALPGLISMVHEALAGVGAESAPEETVAKPTAAQVRRSIQPGALISFLDDKPYEALRLHLRKHGHTSQSYRETFGLPSDYPMVSSNYAARRSELAKAAGFGLGRRKPAKSRSKS